MRQCAIGVSLLVILLAAAAPALAEDGRDGVPGRRVGGGTRWTHQQHRQAAAFQKRPSALQRKLSAMAFASRTYLPRELKLRVLYG